MISFLNLIIINLIWILYSMTEGVREGYFAHFDNLRRRKCGWDINKLFKFQRLIVLISLTSIAFWIFGAISVLYISVGLFFMFSFLHNGSYHCTRNKLDSENYKLGFKDGSTPKLFSTFRTWRERILLFLIGVAMQSFLYIFLIK